MKAAIREDPIISIRQIGSGRRYAVTEGGSDICTCEGVLEAERLASRLRRAAKHERAMGLLQDVISGMVSVAIERELAR